MNTYSNEYTYSVADQQVAACVGAAPRTAHGPAHRPTKLFSQMIALVIDSNRGRDSVRKRPT
jgi:hypothetical protein